MASQPKKRKVEELERSPRLRDKCRLLLLYHLSESRNHFGDNFDPEFRETSLRVLLTSRESVNAFFDSQPRMPCIYIHGDYSYQLRKYFDIHIKLFVESKDLVVLLSLARNLTKLEIELKCGRWTREFIREWMQIAEKINNAPNLTDIELICDYVYSFTSYFILDTLPDKITRVHCDVTNVVFQLLKRQTFLTELVIRGAWKPVPHFAPIFQVKTCRLTFSDMFDLDLTMLADCDPLKRNENIKKLSVYLPHAIQEKMSDGYEDSELLLCSSAFRHLRKLNDHFALHLNYTLLSGASPVKSAMNMIRNALVNVKFFITTAKVLGFGRQKDGNISKDFKVFLKIEVDMLRVNKVPSNKLKKEFGLRLIEEKYDVKKYYYDVHSVPVLVTFAFYSRRFL